MVIAPQYPPGHPRVPEILWDVTRVGITLRELEEMQPKLDALRIADGVRIDSNFNDDFECSYDWIHMIVKGNRPMLERGIAIAEDLPGAIEKWLGGPLRFTMHLLVDPDPTRYAPPQGPGEKQQWKEEQDRHNDFGKNFTFHYSSKKVAEKIKQPEQIDPEN